MVPTLAITDALAKLLIVLGHWVRSLDLTEVLSEFNRRKASG